MANSDDELPPSQELDVSAASDEHRPKKTLLGLGFKLPKPMPRAAPDPAEAARREQEFEAEATQIADHLSDIVLADIDAQMLNAAFGLPEPTDSFADEDLVEDEDFPAEATQIAEAGYDFDGDRPSAELGGLVSDSLPEPIRSDDSPPAEPSPPTFAMPPVPGMATGMDWRKDVPATLLDAGAGLPHDDELPAPIRSNPLAFQGTGDGQMAGEFQTEKTELINSPFEQDPSIAKLVTLEGPLTGQEFFATGLRNTIGRGLNNSIVVADIAMSRQHFEIAKNPDESFTLRDLQSVNGTTLNGTKIREADIFHGDRVEAGKSTFQFVVSGNPPSASRQRRLVPAATSTMAGAMPGAPVAATATPVGMNRMLVMLSVAALAVSLMIIAGLALTLLRAPQTEAAAPDPTGSAVYLEGVEAVKARDWEVARAKFAEAGRLDPKLTGVDEQMRRIEAERAAAKNLAEATNLAERGRYDAANEHVEKIPPDSVYYAEAQNVVRGGRTSEVERLHAEAQEAIMSDDHARARELIDQILALVPTHRGAQDLRERIASLEAREAEAEESNDGAVAARAPRDDFTFELIGSKKKARTSRNRRSRTQRSPQKDPSGSAVVPNFTEGFVLYRTRKFSQAEAFFERASNVEGPAASFARKLADQIGDFEEAYEAGNKAYASKNWAEADRKLLAAKRTDSMISSSSGQFDQELSAKLGSVKANLGLATLDKGDIVKARRYLEQAQSFDRKGSDTQRLASALDKEATSLYVRAANMRKSDPAAAAKLCRTIMDIVPRSNDTHQKADKLLKSL